MLLRRYNISEVIEICSTRRKILRPKGDFIHKDLCLKNSEAEVRVKHHWAAVICYVFLAMHYCKRMGMFALQRSAMLSKFTRSQISTA